ncbi:MAG: N-acetylmuramoyl-L-alanine amidase [Acholeplasmatales bacterium]|nr:N-acetylmuramoyl-L-alanine amidase [Acholeplasmatales bacterium]
MKKILVIISSVLMVLSCALISVSAHNEKIVVIDAGHGGEDGGASYLNCVESEINLEIAYELKKVYEENGYKVIMTRKDNSSLCDGSFNKREDMNNRVNIVNSSNALYLISIHLNTFSDPKYSGAQTFYSTSNFKSILLADLIQTSIISNLRNTSRSIVERDNIYLLNKVTIPAVIVECGFLTNDNERSKLINKEYQMMLAWAIFEGSTLFEL